MMVISTQLPSGRPSRAASSLAEHPALPSLHSDWAGFSIAERRAYLLRHGSKPNAYFHLQPDIEHFDVPGVGFVSFHRQAGVLGAVPIVFLKPICPPDELEGLLRQFIAAHRGRCLFIGADPHMASLLRTMGHAPTRMGTDFNIPLDGFKVAGRRMKYLRTVARNGEKGITVHEQRWSEVDQDAVKRVSEAWRQTKRTNSRELRLLTRPPIFGDAWGVRKFYAYQDGRLVGYVFFDPFFRDGKVVGYTANILRAEPGLKPRGVLDYIVLQAIEVFRAEGMETLSLGLAPLHDVQEEPGDRPVLRRLLQGMYAYGNRLYAFRDLAFHKSRYRGEEEFAYACNIGVGDVSAAVRTLLATNVL